MQHDTLQGTRIDSAVALYNHLRVQPGILLNLTKHLVSNVKTPHAITAFELMPLAAFPKKIVWTLYPTGGGPVAARDIVTFTQKLYSIKEHTKTIDFALNSIEHPGDGMGVAIGNAITSLIALKNLCLSYTNLVDIQLHVGESIRNLAFAIYTIQKGDEGVGDTAAETMNINVINDIDMNTLPPANVTEDRLRALRNVLVTHDYPTSANLAADIPREHCVFFIEISAALDQFVTTYLLPCVRASLEELVTAIPAFELPVYSKEG